MSKKNRKTEAEAVDTQEAEALALAEAQADGETTPKAKREKKPTRLTEEAIVAKYPHAQAGTLVFETEGHHKGKQTIVALLDCGHEERVATSDLFQVKRCKECKKPLPRVAKEPKEKAPKAKKAIDPAHYNKPTFVPVSFQPSEEALADLATAVS